MRKLDGCEGETKVLTDRGNVRSLLKNGHVGQQGQNIYFYDFEAGKLSGRLDFSFASKQGWEK